MVRGGGRLKISPCTAGLELQIGFRIFQFLRIWRGIVFSWNKIDVIGNNVMQQICNFMGDTFFKYFLLSYYTNIHLLYILVLWVSTQLLRTWTPQLYYSSAVVTYPSIHLKREIISIIVTDNSCGEYQKGGGWFHWSLVPGRPWHQNTDWVVYHVAVLVLLMIDL